MDKCNATFRYREIANTSCLHYCVLPNISEARQFMKVVLSSSLQTNSQHNHSIFPCNFLRASTLTNMCLGRLVTGCESINKWSVACWTRTLHQGSNIAYFSVVNFKTFLVYIYKVQPVQFAKMMTLFRFRTGWGVILRSQ